MTTVYPSSDGYFQQDNQPCHKAQIISDWFLEHDNEFTLLKWPPQSPDLNPIEHIWDVVEREIQPDVQPTNLQQLRDAIMSILTKINEGYFSNTLLNLCHEELRQFWRVCVCVCVYALPKKKSHSNILLDRLSARICRGIILISFSNVTTFIPVQSCIYFSPRSCIDDGKVVAMYDVGITSSASLLTLMHPSLWNRVNLDSSDHMTFFHCSKVQYLCSLAYWILFSPISFTDK